MYSGKLQGQHNGFFSERGSHYKGLSSHSHFSFYLLLQTIYGMSESPIFGFSPFLPAEFEDLLDGKLQAMPNTEVL